jgi:hypothetical protein
VPVEANILPLSYAAMRSRWCLAALRAFLKRWGVYLGMAGLAFGAGATGGLAAVAAVAAWTVLPLAWVVAHANWGLPTVAELLGVLAVQTLSGVALLRALRPMLWPVAWRDSEAALPLAPQAIRRSDATLSALALSLWWAVQAVGMANLLAQRPPWLHQASLAVVAAWVLSQALGWALGLRALQRARRPVVGHALAPLAARAEAAPRRLPWWWALLVLPTVRGVARGLGLWWLASLVLLCLPAGLLWWQPGWAQGVWAAWSVAALALASRMNHLSRLQLGPLLSEAALVLPLPEHWLQRARRMQLLLPAGLAAALLLAVALWGAQADTFRAGVLAAWVGVAGLSLWWASGQPPRQSDEAALRWLLSLVVQLALSTEVCTEVLR